jgi:hypothetical protein
MLKFRQHLASLIWAERRLRRLWRKLLLLKFGGERISMSPRGGGWMGESWKSPLKTNLLVKLGYSGLFSGISGKSGVSGKISGVSGVAPSQRNEHTAATSFANPVPPSLPGSDSPLLLLLVCLFGLNLNLMNSLRISYWMNMECLHFTDTNNQVAPPIWQRQARKDTTR